MKTRSRFVSNSSSSSFVLAFNKAPQNVDEMRKILFGENSTGTEIVHIYDFWGQFNSQEISERVLKDLREVNESSQDFEFDVYSGYYDGLPELNGFKKGSSYDWKAYDEAIWNYGKKTWNSFKKDNNGCIFYIVNYGDRYGDSLSATIEHGDIFNKIPHLVASHH